MVNRQQLAVMGGATDTDVKLLRLPSLPAFWVAGVEKSVWKRQGAKRRGRPKPQPLPKTLPNLTKNPPKPYKTPPQTFPKKPKSYTPPKNSYCDPPPSYQKAHQNQQGRFWYAPPLYTPVWLVMPIPFAEIVILCPGGATTNGPDATTPQAICHNSRGGGSSRGSGGGGSCRGSGGGCSYRGSGGGGVGLGWTLPT